MFAERFDSLMNIAEVSNSLLGRTINMDSSHIGRFRSGARPLPKKHAFLTPICRYLAGRITKEYQLNALRKLTGIGAAALASQESTALYLERWLTEKEKDTSAATGRLISGFTRLSRGPGKAPGADEAAEEAPPKCAAYLYGNAGKRKAVEQFFLMILQEEKPQTLLLFSDEEMAWLSEDAAFAARWAELFAKVIRKGNRVRIVHTLSRDIDYLLWSVTNWLPIYMTGAIEPYCYPRLRDGLFQRTMFIAPQTAAVVSASVQQETDGMLNLFLTDQAALDALTSEYNRFFALCRPLIQVYSANDTDSLHKAIDDIRTSEGNAILSYAMPPLFAMPEALVREVARETGSTRLFPMWQRSFLAFQKAVKHYRLSVAVLDPELMLQAPESLTLPISGLLETEGFSCTREQYLEYYGQLLALEKQYGNLSVFVQTNLVPNMLVYAKEDIGAVMVKTDTPISGFVSSEKNMAYAFWDYLDGQNKKGGPVYNFKNN